MKQQIKCEDTNVDTNVKNTLSKEISITCGKYCYGFTYCDKEYNLHLDVTCAFLQPSIKHEGHEHALTLFQNLHFVLKCAACCSFASADASFLHCMECNFNVHLHFNVSYH